MSLGGISFGGESLVGLVAAERDGDPLGRGEEQIGDVERDEGGAAKPAGPAEEQQRPIAGAVERRRQRGGDWDWKA